MFYNMLSVIQGNFFFVKCFSIYEIVYNKNEFCIKKRIFPCPTFAGRQLAHNNNTVHIINSNDSFGRSRVCFNYKSHHKNTKNKCYIWDQCFATCCL